MRRLDLADLMVIAGRVLDLDPDEVLAVADLEVAGEVLAEADRCQVLQWSAATLLHGLATRRPFGRRSTEVAVLAALQLLGILDNRAVRLPLVEAPSSLSSKVI